MPHRFKWTLQPPHPAHIKSKAISYLLEWNLTHLYTGPGSSVGSSVDKWLPPLHFISFPQKIKTPLHFKRNSSFFLFFEKKIYLTEIKIIAQRIKIFLLTFTKSSMNQNTLSHCHGILLLYKCASTSHSMQPTFQIQSAHV